MDEAHSIRNRQTETAKAAFQLQSRRRWCITGCVFLDTLEYMGKFGWWGDIMCVIIFARTCHGLCSIYFGHQCAQFECFCFDLLAGVGHLSKTPSVMWYRACFSAHYHTSRAKIIHPVDIHSILWLVRAATFPSRRSLGGQGLVEYCHPETVRKAGPASSAKAQGCSTSSYAAEN